MITLEQMRERVTEKLAEVSGVFWDETARNNAINDAARLVATVTKGIPTNVGPSSPQQHWASYSGALSGVENTFGWFIAEPGQTSQIRLPAVRAEDAYMITRGHDASRRDLPPLWVEVSEESRNVSLSPIPRTGAFPNYAWGYGAKVIPPPVVDGQNLFMSNPGMDKYITPTMLLACAYLLLQERFDNDAERFYNMALQELQILGVDSHTVPALERGLGPSQVAQ